MIISPSGNFYGSEQVLFDYLGATKLEPGIALPEKCLLAETIASAYPRYKLSYFTNKRLKLFYVRVFLGLLGGRYDRIYLNEAGHVKYLLLLARLFPQKRFVIHVRIIEDAAPDRWVIKPPGNVRVLAISEWLKAALPVPAQVLYDPYPFSSAPVHVKAAGQLRIGIIGRVTPTKGLDTLQGLINALRASGEKGFCFLLFGSVAEEDRKSGWIDKIAGHNEVKLEGFVEDKDRLYGQIDCVLHLSTQEALGRIFLEALEKNLPFSGFNAAGIGEIARLLGLNRLLAPPGDVAALMEKLQDIAHRYEEHCREMARARQKAAQIFNLHVYSATLDKLLSE